MMHNLGIKYKTIKAQGLTMLINNFIMPSDVAFFDKFLESAVFLKDYIEKYIVDTNVEPYRKVYLSRLAGPNTPGYRIDNEEMLIKYFASIGFEHTDQNHFANINDQIKFFYETKIVCGLTGSGLTNMLFMKDFQTVIELVSLMEFPGPNGLEPIKEEIHDFYKMMAFDKKHTLVNIVNANKKHEDLTKLISNQMDILRNL
jgi:capsular polysaccharide biosynthesis protein